MNIIIKTVLIAIVGTTTIGLSGCSSVPKAAQMNDCTNAYIGTGAAQLATNDGLTQGTAAADNISTLSGAAGDVAAAGVIDGNVQLTNNILGGLNDNVNYLRSACPKAPTVG